MPEPVVDDPGPGPAEASGADAPDAGAVAPPDAAPEPDAAGSGGLRVEGLSVVYPAGRAAGR